MNERSNASQMSQSNERMHTGVLDCDKLKRFVDSGLDISKQQLIQLQINDAALVKLQSVRDLNGSSQYVLCNGVLMRTLCDKHWPSDVPIKQIVVPISLLQKLICVAHDELISANLGVKKTLDCLQK